METATTNNRVQIGLIAILFLFGCANGVTTLPDSLAPEQREALDAFVDSALERYDVPGVAVAVIKDGRIAYRAGYGVRDRDTRKPMTASTLVPLASVTKPMTTTMMGSLADDGVLDWDIPVQKILPDFAVSNPDWTPHVRVRQLAGMSSGVPENNTSLFLQNLPPTGVIDAVAGIESWAPPGELYGYSNHAFSTGAFAVTVLAGATYDDASMLQKYARLMRERVFAPIGMKSATLDFDAAVANEDHATPHRYEPARGTVESMSVDAERFEQQVAPGASVWSDVTDVAKFAISHFDGTTAAGTRILSEESLRELHRPAVDMLEPGSHYALGWEVWDDYLGLSSLRHTGNSLGFTTSVRIVQDGRIGVVVLANAGFVDGFVAAVDRFVLELLLGREPSDDSDTLGADTQLHDVLSQFASQLTPASRAEAAPFLGSYVQADVSIVDDQAQLQTDFGAYPLYAFGAPDALAVGSMLTGVFVIQRDTETGVVTMGRAGTEPLLWPQVLEPIGQ